MPGLAILPLLAIVVLIFVVVIAVQRTMKKSGEKRGGADIVSYLVLALAMGVTGFALVELANTAFPGDRFIFDPAQNVATSLAAIVVAAPFLVYFWRRQADRRAQYPESAGWTLYLAMMELVFLSAFTVSAVFLVNRIITGEGTTGWTAVIVFGAIVAFHEVAARKTPAKSDAAELPRVVGSAIGLITAMIGLAGTVSALFSLIFALPDMDFDPWLAMLIVGAPIWFYRWVPQWPAEPGLPRLVWTVLVSIGSFGVAAGTASGIGVLSLQYVFGDTAQAGQHFDPVPPLLGVFVTTLAVWIVHRRALGPERDNALRAYEYGSAAIGLAGAVVGAIGLTIIAFNRSLLVGGGINEVIAVTVSLVVGLVVWLVFSRRYERGDPGEESTAWPRRIYNLGLGVVFGLVAAGALITTLFILLRRVLGDGITTSLLIPFAIFLYTGLAAWYLLAAYGRDRESATSEDIVRPFDVTIICAHPGAIATRFPAQAHLKVIHRGDGLGVIDDEMATEIVAAVDNKPSLVWVDGDGFRIAPSLTVG